MWVFQLYKDRNVAAQLEALEGLCRPILQNQDPKAPSHETLQKLAELVVKVLEATVQNQSYYYRVRCRAAELLGELAVQGESSGVLTLHKVAHQRCVDEETQLPFPNDFSDLSQYFVRRSCLEALAGAREAPGADVFKLLLLLLKHNDNSESEMSDGDYVATLLRCLARATPNTSVVDKTNKQIQRYMQRDRLMPSFGHAVTCAALDAMQHLQSRGIVRFDPAPFLAHAKVGQSSKIRAAALGCLARLTPLNLSILKLLLMVR